MKNEKIISDGFNTPPIEFKHDSCEDKNGKTKWYVLHAEAVAILKTSYKNSFSCKKSSIYITHSPCQECSKLIYLSQIKRVIFLNIIKNNNGLNFLKKLNIEIDQISLNKN